MIQYSKTSRTGVMKLKIKPFGNNIAPACEYCALVTLTKNQYICSKKGNVDKSNKCFRYKYDPLKRVPKVQPKIPEYKSDDFKI